MIFASSICSKRPVVHYRPDGQGKPYKSFVSAREKNAVMTYTCKITYANSSPRPLRLVLEPWAEEHLIQPGLSVEVVGTGGEAGSYFELEQLDDRLIIYGWPGSRASIIHPSAR